MVADVFAERYGPWALVAGASDGIGAAYARAMAERGINVVLIARRQQVLDDVAGTIRARTGVRTRVLAIDLATDGALAKIADATADLEIGMLMYCAGADPAYQPFLASPIGFAVSLTQRNCVVPMQLCHHFAPAMVARGKGGIVLVGSGAGLVGGPNMVAYGATKAFGMVLAEGLWAELHDTGVDVLGLVLGATDTPALRRLLAARGVLPSPEDTSPIPGALTPDETVAEAIASLRSGPTCFVGERTRRSAAHLASLTRNDAVNLLIRSSGGTMQDHRDRTSSP
jgi:short-subunit dehydrogenase